MNYFEYFSEIEERFTARRGSLLLLSTLDWALIETWREAGVPLAAVLRGIDAAFDKYDERKARARHRLGKVNGLAWCAQAVMQAAVEMADAAVGGRPDERSAAVDSGFEERRIRRFLLGNAEALEQADAGEGASAAWAGTARATAVRLRELAAAAEAGVHASMEELDRNLTVLEERLHAALLAALPEPQLLAMREAADRELAPIRSKMGAVQLRQLRDQYLQRRMLERYGIPRLSLFYMPLDTPVEEPGAYGHRSEDGGDA